MHQTGQSFRFLLNVENVFLYSSKSFPLKNLLVDIYFPKIIPRQARRIFEMDIFSTHESSRGPRNSNNEFRNERFRSFPNFHQSMNVIPAAIGRSLNQTQFFSFPSCVCISDVRIAAGTMLSPIRPITWERKESWRNRQGVERYADTLRGGPPLSPRLGDPRQRPEAFDGESDESRLCEIEGPVSLGIAIYGDTRVISLVCRPTRPNDYYDLRIRPRLITYVLLEIVYYVHFKKLTLFNLYILLLLLYTYYWYNYHIENFWKK